MEDRLASLTATRPWAKSPDGLVTDLDALHTLRVELEATWLAHLRELDGQGIPARDGATSTAVWLRNRYLIGMSTAHRYVRVAARIDAAPEPVQNAVATGEVNLDQADAITRALADLPRDIGVEVRDLAAEELVRHAGELDPALLTHVGNRILHLVAPDAADEADRRALERAEARARDGRAFTMTPDPSGHGVRVSGRLTNEGAAVVRAAVEPLCAPVRQNDSDEPSAAPVDARTPAQRRADGLVDICRLALNTTELPTNGGDRPQVVVTMPYDILQRELGAGTLDNGDQITPESARRIACDCRLLPIVFNSTGQPLDVGRTKRLVGGPLRQALVTRDRGCTFPACDRGPRWTDAHHIVSWAAGGPTALNNVALLCPRHHTEIHKPGGWTIHMAADGLPTFTPPRHIDPEQKPRRNRYHRRP